MMRPARGSRNGAAALVMLCGLVIMSGCSLAPYAATPVPSTAASTAPTTAPSSAAPCTNNADALRSYEPDGALPGPDDLPAGSTMAKIKQRGRLIAGVSADTYLLGARNPFSGQIEGFDIEMVKAVTQAIFGNQTSYELKVITAAQRIPALQDGTVDIVARNMTINCERWRQIAFSSEYYSAGQKILVRRGSTAKSIEDLNSPNVRVCAPNATSSMTNLKAKAPKAVAVGSDNHTGCLVLFQQGAVDAITGDDTVLAGLAAQDPYAVVPPQNAFTREPYGLGIKSGNVDFVRFVNAVLEQLRTSGDWTKIYNVWLRAPLGTAPSPPKAAYGR